MTADDAERTPSVPQTGTASTGELAGARVLLTGATGFLGQAMLERLLSGYPDTRICVLIRPRGGRSAADRLTGLLRKNVFRPLRTRLGEERLAQEVRDRVTVIEGDLGAVQLPADLDVVIHGASTVSFDPPVDEAFRTNVAGVVTLYQALIEAGATPHVVHISTAYVAGTRKGVVPEAALDHQVDWRLELEMALAARTAVERDSRRPEVLRRALAEAGEQHAKAGPQSTAADAERLRTEWVTRRLVDYGRTRAQSLGWPDVYTLTKALGERVAEELWARTDRPLSVVRPAIVESALRHPYPGWIDGFKMADPLIIALGRGVLREFPGLPDSVLDVIPVDLVVNAILGTAARGPATRGPAAGAGYLHIGSGASNPLTFRTMYELCWEYFDTHPLPDRDRGHIAPPAWRFPGSQQVELMLRTGEKAAALTEKVLLRLPPSQRFQSWLTDLGRRQQDLTQLREYADLYGVYARAEVIYDDHRLRELHAALPAAQAAEHGCDPTVIDWRAYLQDVHCPSITATVRRAGERRGRASQRRARAGTGRRDTPVLPQRTDVAAVFDLEGTIVASNVVESYLWARLATLPRSGWLRELADLARCAPRYLYAERRDRSELLRAFLRRYAGVRADELRALATEVLGDALLHRVMPEATRQIRRHRAAGHRTVLITGAVDLHVEPLSVLFDEVVASRMHEKDGVLTGFLATPPLVDEARAAWLRQYAQRNGLVLDRSYAYADSYSDRPLLEAVGHPQVVNPDTQLFRHARRHRWTVHRWGEHTGGLLTVLLDVTRADVRGGLR